jgi:hypothetical protein
MKEFLPWCALLNMQGAINNIHISIVKPQGFFSKD